LRFGFTPLTGFKACERMLADGVTHKSQGGITHGSGHASHLPVAAFGQRDLKPRRWDGFAKADRRITRPEHGFQDVPDLGRLSALAVENHTAAQVFQREFGGRYATAESQRIFDDPEIDAVIIATSVQSHFPLAKASLLAGKHTFIEKPMAASSAECEELIAIARKEYAWCETEMIRASRPWGSS
jgi:hypothetical protein